MKEEAVTVECPICHQVIEIKDYNGINRSDALVGHIATYHMGPAMPETPEEGPPLPRKLGIKWPWKE